MIVFDIEATGLDRNAEVLQFAAMKYIKNKGVLKYVGYVNLFFYRDSYVVPKAIEELTGLKVSELKKHKDEFYNNMVKLVSLLQSEDCIIGKNIKSYDVPVLMNFIRRYTKTPYGEASGYDAVISSDKVIDLHQSFGKTFKTDFCGVDGRFPLSKTGKKRVGTLTEWGQALNIELTPEHPVYKEFADGTGFHNALYDTFITSKVFEKVFAPIYKEEYQLAIKANEQLESQQLAYVRKEGV